MRYRISAFIDVVVTLAVNDMLHNNVAMCIGNTVFFTADKGRILL